MVEITRIIKNFIYKFRFKCQQTNKTYQFTNVVVGSVHQVFNYLAIKQLQKKVKNGIPISLLHNLVISIS